MINFLYQVFKDLLGFYKKRQNPVPRLVKYAYLKESGLEEKWKSQGYDIVGVYPDQIETKKLDGWEVLTDYDIERGETYYLQLRDGLIFMGKKESP